MKQAIIIIGGYNSLWPAYLRMARDLEDLSGLQAIGVPLMPWHWWTAERGKSALNMLQKLQETVIWARHKFGASEFILVGHSAGGVIARLYLHEGPVWGRVYAGADHVHTIITLGSPHCSDKDTDTGWMLTDEANRLVPGTPYAGRVRYRTVMGEYLRGNENGNHKERRAYRTYQFFTGQGDVRGDGIVPIQSARLDGAESLLLGGVAHSRKLSGDWYGGSKAIIRRWWSAGEPRRGPHAN
jgi:pimeloyl-ACP methyl ester carboxylesterase